MQRVFVLYRLKPGVPKGPGIAQVVAEWPDYCDADSVLTVFVDKIA